MAEKIENSENIDDQLAEFRRELLETKRIEDASNAHFRGIELEELTAEDMKMWEDCKANSVKHDEFYEYGDKIVKSGSKAREAFLQFLANKITYWR